MGYGSGAVGLAALTLTVYLAFPGAAHNGQIAGNQAMAIPGAWGLYGLGLVLVDRLGPDPRLRTGARLVLVAALAYLVVGGLLGNARWAQPQWRYPAYAAVLGGTWASEYLVQHRPDDPQLQGRLALLATAVSYGVVAFEVVRWLEPAFTLKSGAELTPAIEAWQESTRLFWTTMLWGACATLSLGVGARLKSSPTRLLGAALASLALVYTAVSGLPNPAAAPALRTAAFVTLVFGSLAGAYLGLRQAQGRERIWLNGLVVLALIVGLYWISK